MDRKWCPGHQKFHLKTAFGRNCSAPDGLATYCKTYANYLQKLWKRKNAGKVEAERRKYLARVKRRNLERRSIEVKQTSESANEQT